MCGDYADIGIIVIMPGPRLFRVLAPYPPDDLTIRKKTQ